MVNYILLWVVLVFWAAWAVFITRKVNDWFTRKYVHLSGWGAQHDPAFKGFNRNDFHKWNRQTMILGGIFLLPLRLAGYIIALILSYVVTKILIKIYGIKDLNNQNKAFRNRAKFLFAITTRTLLFFLGFHQIEHIVKPFKKTYNKLKPVTDQKLSILISNHVTFADALYFITRPEGVSLLTKEGVIRIPIVGLIVKGLQCVVVDRQNKDSRRGVMEEIAARFEKLDAGMPVGPIFFAVEGGVSNGRTLLQFKKGAFACGRPLKVFSLKYFGDFSPSYNMIHGLDLWFGLMMQPFNSLTVLEIAEPVAPNGEMPWEEFAEAVKDMMCEEFGFERTENSLKQSIECHKKYGSFGEHDFE